jgi:hypothetical protein
MKDELAIVALAARTRLPEANLEAQRVHLLAQVLEAGRDASTTLQAWVTQLLSEHRGSLTSWDLSSTGDRMVQALDDFQAVVGASAPALRQLVKRTAEDRAPTPEPEG